MLFERNLTLASHESFAEKDQALHQFQAIVSRARFSLSPNQEKTIRTLCDDKTDSMPIVLSLAVGIPVQCTKNMSTTLKLANGSIGYVVKILYDPDDSTRTYVQDGVEHILHSLPPLAAYVKLIGYEHHSFFSHFPLGVVPLKTAV